VKGIFNYREKLGVITPSDTAAITTGPQKGAFSLVDSGVTPSPGTVFNRYSVILPVCLSALLFERWDDMIGDDIVTRSVDCHW